ncbi:MAG TPA: alpha/beta hydrolase [Candidatus Baltobacteraceae bacterium]|jgi:pimeloyl-ACP methyl ester carboxylesterase
MSALTRCFRFLPLTALILIGACSRTSAPLLPASNVAGAIANSAKFVNFTKLVSIGHHRALFMHCAGPVRGTRIVFVNGAGDTLEVWSQVQQALSKVALTCSYDPAGIGDSGPMLGKTTNLAKEASDLHALLAAAKIPSPEYIVGHSIGGSMAVYYASKYGNEVSGEVVLDATWLPVFAIPILDQELHAAKYDPSAVKQEMQSVTNLGSLSLRVLSHDPKVGPSQNRAIDRQLHKAYPSFEHLWSEGQIEIAQLSTAGTHRVVPNAWHYIMLAAPRLTITTIEQLAGLK